MIKKSPQDGFFVGEWCQILVPSLYEKAKLSKAIVIDQNSENFIVKSYGHEYRVEKIFIEA